MLALAWTLYAVTYTAFGLLRSWKAAWLVLVVYAFHYGLAEGGSGRSSPSTYPGKRWGAPTVFSSRCRG